MTEEEAHSPAKVKDNDEEELGKEEEPELKTEALDANEEFKATVLEVFDMFDQQKDMTIEVASLATLLRWCNFNPTEKELHSYMVRYDPYSQGRYRQRDVMQIVEERMHQPDTFEELIEALKTFDYDQDGRITTSEFRWFMCKIGDPFDEPQVDVILKEVDPGATGFIDILSYSKLNFGIKEEKPKEVAKKDAAPAKKKKK